MKHTLLFPKKLLLIILTFSFLIFSCKTTRKKKQVDNKEVGNVNVAYSDTLPKKKEVNNVNVAYSDTLPLSERIVFKKPPEDDALQNLEELKRIKYFLNHKFPKKSLMDSEHSTLFNYASVDVNGDGKKEQFIFLYGMDFCGSGGCTMLLLDENYKKIERFTIVDTPVIVRKNKKNGWSVLIVHSDYKERRLVYKNGSYPSNPSVAPEIEYKFQKGDTILFGEKGLYNYLYQY